MHGGAWCNGDLNECQIYAEGFARAGLAVASIDFRHAGDGYPTSLADINYAIRWVKANASELNTRADLVGIAGQSSGGHLGMLAAMRPNDPRYAAIQLPSSAPAVDATVRAVAMLWPVINPLSRYRHALRARDSANPPAWVGSIPQRHDPYWKTEANMAEGNPMLMLERGEKVLTPPAIWIQGQPDIVHDYRDPDAPIAGMSRSASSPTIARLAARSICSMSTMRRRRVPDHSNRQQRSSTGSSGLTAGGEADEQSPPVPRAQRDGEARRFAARNVTGG